MRTFLLAVFWVTNLGNVIQLLIIVLGAWLILSGSSSFLDLTINVFVTQTVPWLAWIKSLLVQLLGDFGRWILTIPILIIAPVKLVIGTIIGLWAYSVAKDMPVKPVHT